MAIYLGQNAGSSVIRSGVPHYRAGTIVRSQDPTELTRNLEAVQGEAFNFTYPVNEWVTACQDIYAETYYHTVTEHPPYSQQIVTYSSAPFDGMMRCWGSRDVTVYVNDVVVAGRTGPFSKNGSEKAAFLTGDKLGIRVSGPLGPTYEGHTLLYRNVYP